MQYIIIIPFVIPGDVKKAIRAIQILTAFNVSNFILSAF